jgi:hypothetical protein
MPATDFTRRHQVRALLPLLLAGAAWTLVGCDKGSGDTGSQGQQQNQGDGAGGDDTGDGGDDGGGDNGGGDNGGGDDGGGDDSGGDGGGGDDGGGDGGGGPTAPELAFDGVYGVPNLDDDDSNRTPDWDQEGGASGENDYFEFVIPGTDRELLETGETIELTLGGDTDNIRVWYDGAVAMGDGASNTFTVDRGSVDMVLEIEFADFLTRGEMTATHLDAGGVEVKSVTFDVMAAPLILNNHMQKAEQLWVMDISYRYGGTTSDNEEMRADLSSALGAAYNDIDDMTYDYDVWVQDEIEFGTLTGSDGHRVDLVIDSIRQNSGRGLDDLPEDEFEGPDFIRKTWGSGFASSQDSFGNMEVSPPLTANGVEYPFGRIYWGDAGRTQPTQELTDFLDTQLVQAPFQLDTSFLCVGHVDEWMSFLPDEDAPKGFWLIYSDIDLGYEFLEGLDPDTQLDRYRSGHGYSTVGAILDDNALRSLNEELQADYIIPNLDTMKDELGLDEGDVIRIPGLFEEVRGCGGGTVALIPGTANYQIFTNADGVHQVFLPDPFLREDEGGSDPFITEFESKVPADAMHEYYWVDDWDIYHMGLGEVHCGTNVIRTPIGGWWDSAKHLLGD